MLELAISIVGTISIIAVTVITARSNERIKKIELDAAATREQTQNEHATAEYPNMRDELTATRMALKALSESQERQMDTLKGYVRDVDESLRAVRHSADRQAAMVDSRFQEIPGLIDVSISSHIADCPLRAGSMKLITK